MKRHGLGRNKQRARKSLSLKQWATKTFGPAPVEVGDILIYADTRRSRIVNADIKVNGVPSVMLEPIGWVALMASDAFVSHADIKAFVRCGVWELERKP